MDATFPEVSLPIAELSPACQGALRMAGPIESVSFAFFAFWARLGVIPPTSERLAHRPWPKYRPLMPAVRHAIFLAPFLREMEAASQEQIDEETGAKLRESLVRHVNELEAADDAARPA